MSENAYILLFLRKVFFLLLVAPLVIADTSVYRCKNENGEYVYSDKDCAPRDEQSDHVTINTDNVVSPVIPVKDRLESVKTGQKNQSSPSDTQLQDNPKIIYCGGIRILSFTTKPYMASWKNLADYTIYKLNQCVAITYTANKVKYHFGEDTRDYRKQYFGRIKAVLADGKTVSWIDGTTPDVRIYADQEYQAELCFGNHQSEIQSIVCLQANER